MLKCGMCENTGVMHGWDQDGENVSTACVNDADTFEEQLAYVKDTLKAFIHCGGGCDCIGCEADRDHVEDLIAHLVDLGKEEAVDEERARGCL